MSKLIKSSAILAFARVTNYALLLLSPILLVRILDPYAFGQYREFMVFAMLVGSLATFSIPSNLLYFVPQCPDRIRHYVSHTYWLLGVMSVGACIVLWLFRDSIQARTSFDFLIPLAIYIVLFVNLDFVESYWIATKRAEHVFYYSTVRIIVRLTAVIVTALQTKSVAAILNALIIVEIVRIGAVIVIARRLGLMTLAVHWPTLRQQLSYIIPLGLASSLHHLNHYAGQIAISTQLGVVALAIYAIGSYQVPILGIVRSAIGDAIFPDMVREAVSDSIDRLRLWKKSNVAYTFVVVPVFVVFFWYADTLIPFLFSDRYTAAIPLFRILLLVMLIQCFELSSPLRAANRNRLLLMGNLLMLGTNLTCIMIFFSFFRPTAIFGPAVGLVLGYAIQHVFLGQCITRIYSVRVRDLLKWKSLSSIAVCATFSIAVLAVGELVPISPLLRMLIFSGVFAICYFALIRYARLEEVETLVLALRRKLRTA